MKKLIALTVLVLVFAAVAAGAYYVAFPGGQLAIPEVREAWHEWGEITAEQTEIISHVTIYNPARTSITIESLTYTIYLNDIEFARGHLDSPVQVPAQGEAELVLRTYLNNTKIPVWWVSHLQNGEKTEVKAGGRARIKAFGITFNVPFTIPAQTVETDLEERFDLHDVTIELTPDLVPFLNESLTLYIKEADTSWGEITAATTELLHHVEILNTYDYPVAVPDMTFEYEIYVNDILLGTGTVPVEAELVPPGEAYKLDFSTVVDNNVLDEIWVSHLQNGEISTIVVKVYLVQGGTRVLVHEETRTYETDILEALRYSSS